MADIDNELCLKEDNSQEFSNLVQEHSEGSPIRAASPPLSEINDDVLDQRKVICSMKKSIENLREHVSVLEKSTNNKAQIDYLERTLFRKIDTYLNDVQKDTGRRLMPRTWNSQPNTLHQM